MNIFERNKRRSRTHRRPNGLVRRKTLLNGFGQSIVSVEYVAQLIVSVIVDDF